MKGLSKGLSKSLSKEEKEKNDIILVNNTKIYQNLKKRVIVIITKFCFEK